MTQTEQVDIRQLILEACEAFQAAFNFLPERVLVYYGQKPHLMDKLGVIPIEAYTPSKLNWGEFLLYHSKLGRVGPEDLQPGPTLITKMAEAKGYGVLVKTELVLDKFYIFQGDRYIKWAFSKLEYERAPLHVLKAELEYALQKFEQFER